MPQTTHCYAYRIFSGAKFLMKDSTYRLIATILCTLPSLWAICISFLSFNLLFIAAWLAYFLIAFFWIKNGYAPKMLMSTGTVLGLASLAVEGFLVPLIFTAGSVILMMHVIKCTVFHVEA